MEERKDSAECCFQYCGCSAKKWRADGMNTYPRLCMLTIALSESRRYSLFLLLFRRSLRLPIAIIFGTSSEGAAGEYSDHVKRWKTAMTEAYALAAEKARLSATKGKPFQDRKAQTWTLGTKFLHGTHQSVEDRVNRVHTGKTRFTLWWIERGQPCL